MTERFTETQIQRLMEYGDENWTASEFDDAAERDASFARALSGLKTHNDRDIRDIIANPRNDMTDLQNSIREVLAKRGFIEVHTPIFVSKKALEKMTITDDHPLYRQVFFIDDKRALRPMHAMNLYAVMRKLKDFTKGPVKIFEIGSCFRKESKSNTHLEEFTMLNLVELDPDGDPAKRLLSYISDIMGAVGLEYETVREESDVYVETLDVEVYGTEVASGAVGPHRLDPAHDIHHPWTGIGFGLERLLMLKNGSSSTRKTGASITYLNGRRMD
ncbi:MAG: hypothetical protein J6O90_00780 [Candidatus Methanomethylophilaceae archaeon]|nr:hypothetical protein [Candidatus Methanomethylophilaceae archaeon]